MTGMSLTGRRSEQRAERRRLTHQDRASARLAELSTIQTILADAQERLGAGWAQGTWATYDGGATKEENVSEHTRVARPAGTRGDLVAR